MDKFLIILFLSFLSFGSLKAEKSVKDIERQISLVRARIGQAELEVESSASQLRIISKSVKELEQEIAKLDKSQNEAEKRLNKINKELESISLQIEDGRSQLQVKRTNFISRLRGMYKSRRGLPALSFIFKSEDVHSLYRRANYIQKVIEEDHNQLAEYEALLTTLKDTEIARQSYFKEEREVVERIKLLKAEQVKKKLEDAKVSRDLRDKMESRKVLLASLNKEEAEFEKILKGLMGGSDEQAVIEPPKDDKAVIEQGTIQKKSVFYPVPGTVIQHFGVQKHSDYKDVINIKGIEMSVAEGSLVRAIAEGSVVFSATLPGFGNVVILEHPGKFYSLYGRIKDPVPLGKALGKGDSVGSTTSKDEKGRNFYFELRKNGVPLNPEEYLRRG
jgi:septal ring factor EnvC (AmiA/AmiB activator)